VEYIGGEWSIRKGITVLNRCLLWRSFLDGGHTARIQVHMDRMLHVAAACDLNWSYGPSVGVKALSKSQSRIFLA
jgi:hypothetical protein